MRDKEGYDMCPIILKTKEMNMYAKTNRKIEIEKSIITIGDFNPILPVLNRISKQKILKTLSTL